MIFELFSQVQMLLDGLEELPELSLSGPTASTPSEQAKISTKQIMEKASNPPKPVPSSFRKRPRERGAFWSVPPSMTPRATAFPKLSPSLERQRRELPAGKARQDFLSILRQADEVSEASTSGSMKISFLVFHRINLSLHQGSRVLLVTGDTGCGKSRNNDATGSK